ncbi:MAG: PaaI family thioesterase [Ilumatobacter sp.]|uniref:PaaI family thioesterase n=1 Tax=Ilumatobacter sp. TaxID=1967498 RepID=UPI003C790D7B
MTSSLPDDVAAARIQLGRAYRRLGHAIAGHHVSAASLDAVTAEVERLEREVAGGTARNRQIERPSGDWGPGPADGEEMFSFDERPISGRAAPYGLDLTVIREGDEAVGHVTLGDAHEGAPGRSHGGIISALFDDVFGFVLTIERQAAFTGTLTIRYEQGVPIGEPLQCRVRLDRREGRKLFMSGELTIGPSGPDARSGAHVVTRATAVFISIPEETFGSGARA